MRSKIIIYGLGALLVGSFFMATHVSAKYKAETVKDGGTIKGVAKWKGDIPKLPPIKVFKHMDKCGETVPNPALQVDNGSKGVRFVLVYLEKVAHGKKPEKLEVLHMGKTSNREDSTLCNFEEHVFPYERKTVMGFINYENLLHNPHGFAEDGGTLFNIALPNPNRMVKHHEPRIAGVGLKYQCDTHVHMNGWMAGFNHPYFATTDHKGKFSIADIPPGKYTLVAWHEGYNIVKFSSDNRPIYDEPHIVKQELEVKAGETTEVNFEFPTRDVKVDWKIAGKS